MYSHVEFKIIRNRQHSVIGEISVWAASVGHGMNLYTNLYTVGTFP